MTSTIGSSALERVEAAFADPEAGALAFKKAGGKVVGFLGATVPIELIAAAGAHPLRLKGASGGTSLADKLMEPVRELYLRRIFDRLLSGSLAWLDLLIVPRSSEGLLQFYYLVEYVRTHHGHEHLPKVVLLDLLQTPFDYTIAYNKARLYELKEAIEASTETEITQQAIATEIARYNAARAQFRDFIEQNRPAGGLRLKLASFGQTQPLADFRNLLSELASTPTQFATGRRVALSGSPHETTALYDAFAANGMDIVAEDHDWGAGIYAHDVAESADPIAALEERYRLHGISMRQFVRDKPELDVSGREIGPDAVAFFFEENDDTLGWEYPDERQRLETAGITTALLRGPIHDAGCAAAVSELALQLAGGTEGKDNG